MTCEEVRPLLPAVADGELRSVPVLAHVAGCLECSAELRRYRAVVAGMSSLRSELEEPSEGFLAAVLSDIPQIERRSVLRRAAADDRVRVAALSIGGALVGATAIGLLWRRNARRAFEPAAGA